MGISNYESINTLELNSRTEEQIHAELVNPHSEMFKILSSAFMRAVSCGHETELDPNTDEDQVFGQNNNQFNHLENEAKGVSPEVQVPTGYRLVDAGMDDIPSLANDAVTTAYSDSNVVEHRGRPVTGAEAGGTSLRQEEEKSVVSADSGSVRREVVDIKSSVDLILRTPRDFWFHRGGDDQNAQTIRGMVNPVRGDHVFRAPDDGFGYILVGPYTPVKVQDVRVKPEANHSVIKFTGTVSLSIESWFSEAYVSDRPFGGQGDAGFKFYPKEEEWYSDVDWFLVQAFINQESRPNVGFSADRPCRNCGSETISADCIDCGVTYWDNSDGHRTNTSEFFTASRMDGFQVPFTVSNCHFLKVQPLGVFQRGVRVRAQVAPAAWTDSRVWNYEIFSRYVERRKIEDGSYKLVET